MFRKLTQRFTQQRKDAGMMKKTTVFLLLIVLVLTFFTAASATPITTTIQNQEDRHISVKGQGSDGHFPANPEMEGISPTTGMNWKGVYLPMLVIIDNADGGIGIRAPWGASFADIIYETPLHKNGNTLLTFLFSDTVPENVGPIRSARVTHAELREEWDAGFVFYGGQESAGTNVNDVFKDTGADKKGILFSGIVGTNKPWKKYYSRVENIVSPHNVNANVLAMQSLIPTDFKAPSRPFLFTDELPGEGTLAMSISITQVKPEYSSNFVYDPGTNRYSRYVNEQPYVDKETQEPLSFSNLIIQRTSVTYYQGFKERPMTVNIGSGNAELFIGGRYIPGYWVRTGMNERTVFFDQNGNEIRLQRGKTFISLLDYDTQVTYAAK
jgi:hypothetical protein